MAASRKGRRPRHMRRQPRPRRRTARKGITGSAWLIVIGFVGHGLKDLWQHRSHYVANTRWWPPFCMTIDFVAAAIIAVAIV